MAYQSSGSRYTIKGIIAVLRNYAVHNLNEKWRFYFVKESNFSSSVKLYIAFSNKTLIIEITIAGINAKIRNFVLSSSVKSFELSSSIYFFHSDDAQITAKQIPRIHKIANSVFTLRRKAFLSPRFSQSISEGSSGRETWHLWPLNLALSFVLVRKTTCSTRFTTLTFLLGFVKLERHSLASSSHLNVTKAFPENSTSFSFSRFYIRYLKCSYLAIHFSLEYSHFVFSDLFSDSSNQ